MFYVPFPSQYERNRDTSDLSYQRTSSSGISPLCFAADGKRGASLRRRYETDVRIPLTEDAVLLLLVRPRRGRGGLGGPQACHGFTTIMSKHLLGPRHHPTQPALFPLHSSTQPVATLA